MKSIKEKAEELYPTRKVSAVSDLANEKFVEGANYVLEEIEKVIRSNSTCEKAILELGKLVIQLKK